MENRPLVSILIATHNDEDTIEECLESIENQNYGTEYIELVIINDYSTDRTNEILDKFEVTFQGSLVINKNRKNLGLTKSLNIGLKLCTGKYIIRMDADDIMLKSRIKYQVNFLECNPDYVLVSSAVLIHEKGKVRGLKIGGFSDSLIRELMMYKNPFTHPAITYRNIGVKYDEEYKYAQDYKYCYELMKLGKAHILPKPVLKYRVSKSSLSLKYNYEQMLLLDDIRSLIRIERTPKRPRRYFERVILFRAIYATETAKLALVLVNPIKFIIISLLRSLRIYT